MELITGRTGEPHVYAADDAELYKMFFGNGDFVLTTGNQLEATISGTAPNTINVADGSVIMQGRLAKIRPTDGFDALQYDVGQVGYRRVDLIVAEYNQTVITEEKEIEGEVVIITDVLESVELKIVKGTPNATQYVEPEIVTGNIDLGETHQVKLYAIHLDGINYDGLVDYRIILDTTPIQTALDYAESSISNIDNIVFGYESRIRAELDRIMSVARVAPLTVIVAHNLSATAGVLIVPSASYSYTTGDVFVLYLNGLRATADIYSVGPGTNELVVTLDSKTDATYEDIEIEVWRPE